MAIIGDWSYSGDPSNSPLDEVRFLIGDTDSSAPQLTDHEILYQIAQGSGENPNTNGNFLAAAFCADAIAAKYTRLVDKSVGKLRISRKQFSEQFHALASELRRRATVSGVAVYSGGQSVAEKAAENANDDRVQPTFKIDSMSNVSTLTDGTTAGIDR